MTSSEIRLSQFGQALNRLTEALELPKDDVVRDASIQRFEFTFETAGKLFRRTLPSSTPEKIRTSDLRIRRALLEVLQVLKFR